MAPPNIRVRGSIPRGFLVGRSSAGQGDQQLLDYNQLAQQMVSTGVVASAGAVSSNTVAGLSDVDVSAVADGDVFTYDAGSGLWKPVAPSGGGGGGLFGQVMSALPTAASTGLSAWVNQGGASVADSATGVTITAASNASAQNYRIRKKTAPTAPYTITALMGLTVTTSSAFSTCGLGWYDGSNKVQTVEVNQRNNTAPPLVFVVSYSSPSVLNAAHYSGGSGGNPGWVQIADDGTNVSFRYSMDGANFKTVYTVAKASGYLGSSGYSNIVFGLNPFASDSFGTLMSYTEA